MQNKKENIAKMNRKKIIDFEYKARRLFFSFIESVEGLDESFCDCNAIDGIHEKDCMTSLFRLDVQTLENRYNELKNKYSELFLYKSGKDDEDS
jgi:hypothetical protein